MKGKYIVPLILASVTATTFGAHAQINQVKADYSDATVLEGGLVQVGGVSGEGSVGVKHSLPFAVVKDSAGD